MRTNTLALSLVLCSACSVFFDGDEYIQPDGGADGGGDAGVDATPMDATGDAGNDAAITCEPGFWGPSCTACECDATLCDDGATGDGTCGCDLGFTGPDCASCDDGFYEYPEESGLCVDDPCEPEACSDKGACDASSGGAVCTCIPGYTGVNCSICAAGFYEFPAGSRDCVLDPCLPNPCNDGTCSGETGVAECTCPAGVTGDDCSACDEGFVEFPVGTGACLDNPCVPEACNDHGTCAYDTGVALCSCGTGYVGDDCSSCDAGFIEFPAGTCIADPCTDDSCSMNGTCSNTTGVAACTCDAGYAGADCSSCDVGFIEFPAGTCIDDPCDPDVCSGNGSCASSSGASVCSCDDGYSGGDCSSCDKGYYEFPADSGLCVPNPCDVTSCGDGSCNPDTGVAICECSDGVGGASCGTCVRFVDHSATGMGNGLNWADAFTEVQPAIDAANAALGGGTSSCEVWISRGTYYIYESATSDRITLRANVPVYGGFDGTSTDAADRNVATTANRVTLDGRDSSANNNRVTRIVAGASNTRLDGVRIRYGNGTSSSGAGLYAGSTTNFVIANVRFEANRARNGGGLYVNGGRVTILNSEFIQNYASEGGSGIYSNSATLTIDGTTFASQTGGRGFGIRTASGSLTISDSVFRDNAGNDSLIFNGQTELSVTDTRFSNNRSNFGSAGVQVNTGAGSTFDRVYFNGNHITQTGTRRGGALAFSGASLNTHVVTNCIFEGNAAVTGGAVSLDGASVEMANVTFAANAALSGGGALRLEAGSTASLANVIFSGNTSGSGDQEVSNAGTLTAAYSLSTPSLSGTGNITGDPAFVRAPDDVDRGNGSGSRNYFTPGRASAYMVGDVIRIQNALHSVTAATSTRITFSPTRSSNVPGGAPVAIWRSNPGETSLDLHLTESSPCIDAGDGDAAPMTDYEDSPRVDAPVANTGVGTPDYTDPGAYEYQID